MAARADVNIRTQYGPEVTPGTGVSTTKEFPDLDVEFSPEHVKQFFRAAGKKFNSVAVMNKSYAMGSFKGPFNYTSLAVVLSSYANYAAPGTVGTGGKGWTFNPALSTADTIKTYTFRRGDSNRASQMVNGIFNSLDVEITRDSGTISGEVIGKGFSFGNSLAGASVIANKPVSMNDMSIYLDTTSGGLGSTKLTDVFRLSIKLPKKYDMKWVIDAAETSWKEPVEQYMTPKLTIEAEASSQMEALYSALKADNVSNYFLRAIAVGDNIGAGADYTNRFSAALQMTDAKENRKGNGDVYAYNFEFEIMGDDTWGKAWEYYLVNELADV